MQNQVRSATLNGYVGLARSLGLDPERLLRGAGLDPADLAVPDRWVSASGVARLLDASAVEAGVPDFALRLVNLRRLGTLGPLSVVLREEPDLRSVLDLLIRHERTYNEALKIRLTEEDGIASIRLWLELGEPAPPGQALVLAGGALYAILQECAGGHWRPLAVCFSGPAPEDRSPFVSHFGPALQFEHAFTGLVLYSRDLDSKNALADPLMRPYLQQIRDSVVSAHATTLNDRVRELVEFLLPLGRCSVDQVARTLGVDRRTLQRHLASDGESFSALLHTVRSGMAERYLANPRYSMTEVSELLGFTAPSAFSRWFQQQFQMSPRRWRQGQEKAVTG